MPLRLVSREEWKARKPAAVEEVETPTPFVFLKYYTRSEPCFTDKECRKVVRKLQDWHMMRLRYCDIKYNFLIGGEGSVYEGRGWMHVPTKHDGRFLDFFENSIDIAFIGDFQKVDPPPVVLEAANALISYGINARFLKPDVKVFENRKDTIMPYDPGFIEAYDDESLYDNSIYSY